MRFKGFIGPSYKVQSVNVDCQRTVNLYPEINEAGTGKAGEVAALYGTPGLKVLAEIGEGPIRATYSTSNGLAFVVSKNKLFKIDVDNVATEIGTLAPELVSVSMADNGYFLTLVDGAKGYTYVFATGVFSEITDEAFTQYPNVYNVNYLDGRFIFCSGITIFCSMPDEVTGITFDATEFSTVDAYPDDIVAHIVNYRQIWILKEKTTEVWFNSGEAQFPYSRVDGAFIEHGCAARYSLQKIDNSVFWLAKDDNGQGIVYMANGYQPQRISTFAVETAIQKYGNISDAVAYTYQSRGHAFYVLNFTEADSTWVYDLSTGLWHERAFTRSGKLDRHRANCHAFFFGKHVVGDFETNKLYHLDDDTYTDDGNAITRKRVTPHVTNNLNYIYYNALQLDLETGVGADGVGQGVNPQAMMRFSDDGGHSWSNEKWVDMGKIGQRRARAIWRRLGKSRDRVFDVTVTDPVKVVFLGAELDFTQGGA